MNGRRDMLARTGHVLDRGRRDVLDRRRSMNGGRDMLAGGGHVLSRRRSMNGRRHVLARSGVNRGRHVLSREYRGRNTGENWRRHVLWWRRNVCRHSGRLVYERRDLHLELLSNEEGVADTLLGRLGNPVVTAWNDVVAAVIMSSEPKVLIFIIPKLRQVLNDLGVISNLEVGFTLQVLGEMACASLPLLPNKRLSLNLTDEFSNNLLGILLEHQKTLLNNLNLLLLADKLLLWNQSDLLEMTGVVVLAVEAVKIPH